MIFYKNKNENFFTRIVLSSFVPALVKIGGNLLKSKPTMKTVKRSLQNMGDIIKMVRCPKRENMTTQRETFIFLAIYNP